MTWWKIVKNGSGTDRYLRLLFLPIQLFVKFFSNLIFSKINKFHVVNRPFHNEKVGDLSLIKTWPTSSPPGGTYHRPEQQSIITDGWLHSFIFHSKGESIKKRWRYPHTFNFFIRLTVSYWRRLFNGFSFFPPLAHQRDICIRFLTPLTKPKPLPSGQSRDLAHLLRLSWIWCFRRFHSSVSRVFKFPAFDIDSSPPPGGGGPIKSWMHSFRSLIISRTHIVQRALLLLLLLIFQEIISIIAPRLHMQINGMRPGW